MISIKNSEAAHQILADVGLHLAINISLDTYSLTQDGESLHAAITDLNNWRLGDEFFTKHPSFRSLYDSSFHMTV